MPDGFRVDLGALEEASQGVDETLGQLRRKKVSDIRGKAADYGNDHLAQAVGDFCDRWEVGVQHLTKDAEEIAARLSRSAQAYLKVENDLKGHLDGMLRRSGPDPAAQ